MGARKVLLAALSGLGVFVATLALPVASDATVFRFKPPPFGSFAHPTGVAVDESTGDVYVANGGGANDVQIFTANGASVGSISGTPAGPFGFANEPAGVAVDNSTEAADPSKGDVYITDEEHHVVDKFSTSGTFLCQLEGPGKGCTATPSGSPSFVGEVIGAATDSHGNVYVADYTNSTLYIFNDEGSDVAQISTPATHEIAAVAVDSNGIVYTSLFEGPVYKITLNASHGVESEEEIDTESSHGVAVDTVTNDVYVNHFGRVTVHTPSGSTETLEGTGTGAFVESLGLAFNGATGTLYISDARTGHALTYSFSEGEKVPVPVTEAATAIGSFEATLNGSLDPEGTENNALRFEYGTSLTYGSLIAGAPPLVSGLVSTHISATVANLEPNKTYHFRLVNTANAGTGGSAEGADVTFTTTLPRPAIVSETATEVMHRGAQLKGVLNPENGRTMYHFEYVIAASYQEHAANPYAEGAGTQELEKKPTYSEIAVGPEVIGELEPSSVYHYRLVATNAAGTTYGADEMFRTTPKQLPVVTSVSADEETQSTAMIHANVNPDGLPTTYRVEIGTDTNYGSQVFGFVNEGSEEASVSVKLAGLSPATMYHFRLIAVNQDGESEGASDHTFVTLSYPSPIIAPPAQVLVPAPSLPICAEGQEERDGRCVAPTRRPEQCRNGFVREHGKCVRKKKSSRKKKHGKRGKKARRAVRVAHR